MQRALVDLSDGGHIPVLLHVNNLENLRNADLAKAATLVRNLRDYLLVPGGHWLFVGKTGVIQDVFDAREEVGSIMAQPVMLEPLSPEALRALLEVRYQRFRRGGSSQRQSRSTWQRDSPAALMATCEAFSNS